MCMQLPGRLYTIRSLYNQLLRDYRDRDALDKLMTEKRVGAYVGVDPTAPSMHVGHLIPLMALFWMHMYGYFAVTLVSTPR